MKKLRELAILIVIMLSCSILLYGCKSSENSNDSEKQLSDHFSEQSPNPSFVQGSKQYYTMDDFGSLVLGKSTIADVFKLFPPKPNDTMLATSYGAFCDYPMQDGGYIRIKFSGKDLIVFSIEQGARE